MIIHLWMSKGRICHTKVLDSKLSRLMIDQHNIVMPLTCKWECAIYIEANFYEQIIRQWWHTCHRTSGQCAMQICRNDNHHVAFIHKSNYITLLSNPVHIVNILDIGYGRSWTLRRSNWIWQNTQIGLYWWNISIWIKMRWIASWERWNMTALNYPLLIDHVLQWIRNWHATKHLDATGYSYKLYLGCQ